MTAAALAGCGTPGLSTALQEQTCSRALARAGTAERHVLAKLGQPGPATAELEAATKASTEACKR